MNNWKFSIFFGLMLGSRILWPHGSVTDLIGRAFIAMVFLEFAAWQVRREMAKQPEPSGAAK